MAIKLANGPGPIPPVPKRPRRSQARPALVPAAARQTTRFSAEERDLSGDAIETFATAVGGRDKLLQTLAVASSDGHADKVITCLLDPHYASWSLRAICTHVGITVADLFASYKKALFVQAHVEAAHLITSKLPPIVDDVMTRAAPQPLQCPRCLGTVTGPDAFPCAQCHGTGTILSSPRIERQKLALELGRLIERRGGGVVMQQNQIAAATAALTSQSAGSLEQLQQAVGELLFSPARRRLVAPPVDAQVRDPREPTLQVIDAEAPVRDPREPEHPRHDPRQVDLPVPPSEPQDPPDDPDEDDEPTRH